MKKKLNIAELTVQIIFLITYLFVPLASAQVNGLVTTNPVTGNPMLSGGGFYTITFKNLMASGNRGLVLIFIVLVLSNVALCLFSIIKNQSEIDPKIHVALPIINVIFFLFLRTQLLPMGLNVTSHRVDELNASVYTFLIVLSFIIMILAFVKRSKGIIKTTPDTPTQNNDKFKELERYNELLKKELISQEEYDAKKKELLGL